MAVLSVAVLGRKVLGCKLLQPNTCMSVLLERCNRARLQGFFQMGGLCLVLR
jgi:hypothetical protein